MASFNKIIIVGNLTRDPELRDLSNGQQVCGFGIAANWQYKNRQSGATVKEVCFIDVDAWGPQATYCKQYLQKGRPVLVEGRLRFDQWTDKDGQKRNKHAIVADRVVFLGGSQEAELGDEFSGAAPFGGAKNGMSLQSSGTPLAGQTGLDGFVDELPF